MGVWKHVRYTLMGVVAMLVVILILGAAFLHPLVSSIALFVVVAIFGSYFIGVIIEGIVDEIRPRRR